MELSIEEGIVLEDHINENSEEERERDGSDRGSTFGFELTAVDTELGCNPPKRFCNNTRKEGQAKRSLPTRQKKPTQDELNTKNNLTELDDRQHFTGFKCPQCPTVVPKKTQFNRHMRRHDLRKIILCPYCDKKFSTESAAKKHEKNLHLTNYPFECEKCPRKYISQHLFKSHLETHNEKPPTAFKCPQCLGEFHIKSRLEKHMISHLPVEMKKTNACPYCDKKYVASSNLRQHISLVHLKEFPFVCEECGVRLRSEVSLKEHMVRHTDETPFECEVCKHKTKSKHRLKLHMARHNPKISCNKCGVQLSTRHALYIHMTSVHAEIKKYKCDYCGCAFNRYKTLRFHLMRHCDIKPYYCNFCELNFITSGCCRNHAKKEHPEEYASKSKLYTHNAPEMEVLKAIAKTATDLTPIRQRASNKPKPFKTHSVRSVSSDLQSEAMTTDSVLFSDV